jgi:pyrroloquinoline-quinone synthase
MAAVTTEAPAGVPGPAGAASPTADEVEAVIERCAAIVRAKRASAHPFVAELDAVAPDRAGIGRWATAKYHQVNLQNVIFSALHANARDLPEVRHYCVDQLVAEETHHTSGGSPHYAMMRRLAVACGVTDSMLDPVPVRVAPEVRGYVDTLISACRDDDVAYGLLTIWSIESQSGESAGRVLAWLRANHDFTDDELEWFVVHSEDEDDHAAEGIALVRRLALDLPDFPTRAPAVVEAICDAWLVLHDYYRSLLRAPAASEGVAL